VKRPNPIHAETEALIASLLAKYIGQRPFVRAIVVRDPAWPNREREVNHATVRREVGSIQHRFEKQIFPLLRATKKHVPDVLAQDERAACYFLLGKIAGNWRAVFLLAQHGMYYEMMELMRSIKESVSLSHHFLRGHPDHLRKWFSGKIIDHEKIRQSTHRWVNAEFRKLEGNLPMEAVLSYVYSALSKYSHSSYVALLDMYDVWNDDADFYRIAGYHRINDGSLLFMKSVLQETLLILKHFYQYCGDEHSRAATDALLRELFPPVSQEQSLKDLADAAKRFA
jgi:hypothetical protein